ncbi:MAG: recombinase family protein [Cryomorphaceae bacterium]
MRVKYQRTSTLQQHGNRFQADKEIYDLTLFDKGVSGTLPFRQRTEASKLNQMVESGQIASITVEELRDIGRNMVDTINVLDWLDQNEVTVIIKSMGNLCSRVNGRKNEIWGILTACLSSLYQLERENLLNRTRIGREVYVANGGKIGRPEKSNESVKKFLEKPKSKEIIGLLSKGKSVRDIAGRLKCSMNTVIKVRKYISWKRDPKVLVS